MTVFKDTFYKLKFGSKGDPPTSPCSTCDGRENEIADKVNVTNFKDLFYKLQFGSKVYPCISPCSNCDEGVNGIADKVNEA